MRMTYSEALDWLEQVGRGGSRLGLDRVKAYLTKLGAPQDQIPMIHVAGTNGKGSVSACLSAILTQAGYRVGMYTSPHLDRFNERFRIRGEEISNEAFADLVSQGRAVWETMEDKPTEFEVITALAFLYFAQSACDLVVLEVGLGGRLDATNVIPTPLAAVITRLGLDHTAELGDTLARIAYEKAGIIKPGGRVVLDGRNTEVLAQLQQLCRERGCSVPTDAFPAGDHRERVFLWLLAGPPTRPGGGLSARQRRPCSGDGGGAPGAGLDDPRRGGPGGFGSGPLAGAL